MPDVEGFAFLEKLGFGEEIAEKLIKLKVEYIKPKGANMAIATKPIQWLEHPFKYDYLRKRYYQTLYRRYFKKGQTVRGVANDFYKLIGYRLLKDAVDTGDGIFEYELFFLKNYDRGCPNEHPGYAKGNRIPAEAIWVEKIDGN